MISKQSAGVKLARQSFFINVQGSFHNYGPILAILTIMGIPLPGRAIDGVSPIVLRGETQCVHLMTPILSTPEQRSRGFTDPPTPHRSLLFQWNTPTERNFWMRNTPVPIQLMRLKPSGQVESIDRLNPFENSINHDKTTGRFAIEIRLDGLDTTALNVLKEIDHVFGEPFGTPPFDPTRHCVVFELPPPRHQ